MGITLNFIESDSNKIYYRVSGAENSRTIIFVHGLAADSRFFHNQLKYFGNFYRVIAVDLPGHGRARKTGKLSLELYSRSIEQVVKKENIGALLGKFCKCVEHFSGCLVSVFFIKL